MILDPSIGELIRDFYVSSRFYFGRNLGDQACLDFIAFGTKISRSLRTIDIHCAFILTTNAELVKMFSVFFQHASRISIHLYNEPADPPVLNYFLADAASVEYLFLDRCQSRIRLTHMPTPLPSCLVELSINESIFPLHFDVWLSELYHLRVLTIGPMCFRPETADASSMADGICKIGKQLRELYIFAHRRSEDLSLVNSGCISWHSAVKKILLACESLEIVEFTVATCDARLIECLPKNSLKRISLACRSERVHIDHGSFAELCIALRSLRRGNLQSVHILHDYDSSEQENEEVRILLREAGIAEVSFQPHGYV